MTSYEKIITALKIVSQGVNPTGRFMNGRVIDASTAYAGAYPLIHVYPFTIQEDDDGIWDSANILIAFWMQDKPSSTPEDRELLIFAMAALTKTFTSMLKEYNGISVRAVTKEPQFHMLAATLSGFALRFKIQVIDDCNTNFADYLPGDYAIPPDYDSE